MEPRQQLGLMLATGVVVYKACIYANAKYQLSKEKKQKIENLGKLSEYKFEKEDDNKK